MFVAWLFIRFYLFFFFLWKDAIVLVGKRRYVGLNRSNLIKRNVFCVSCLKC